MDNMYAEYEKDKKDLISDFNEAKFQIYRLNLLWIGCNTLSQSGDFQRWKWKLDAIWRELSPDARRKDGYDKDYKGWITKGKKEEESYIYRADNLNNDIANADGRTSFYEALGKKDTFLRCLQDDVGKGSKKKKADEDDIDE